MKDNLWAKRKGKIKSFGFNHNNSAKWVSFLFLHKALPLRSFKSKCINLQYAAAPQIQGLYWNAHRSTLLLSYAGLLRGSLLLANLWHYISK